MGKFILFSCLCLASVCHASTMQVPQPRYIEGKIQLRTITEQIPELYRTGDLEQTVLFSLLQMSEKALTEASRRKVVKTQECLNESCLVMGNHVRIKFLSEPDEKERVTQIVQAIIGRFDSEMLGFSNDPNDIFPNDTPIQRFEDLCIMYDLDELSELENVKLLANFLSEYHGVNSYPNICSLLKLIKQKSGV